MFLDPWQTTANMAKTFADTFKMHEGWKMRTSSIYTKNLHAEMGAEEFAARVEAADGRRKRKAQKKNRCLQEIALGQKKHTTDVTPGKNHAKGNHKGMEGTQ